MVLAMNIEPIEALGIFLQDLHDSEINGELTWLFDRCWTARIGAPVHAEASFNSLGQATEWLRDRAVEMYPDSPFAKEWRRAFE